MSVTFGLVVNSNAGTTNAVRLAGFWTRLDKYSLPLNQELADSLQARTIELMQTSKKKILRMKYFSHSLQKKMTVGMNTQTSYLGRDSPAPGSEAIVNEHTQQWPPNTSTISICQMSKIHLKFQETHEGSAL